MTENETKAETEPETKAELDLLAKVQKAAALSSLAYVAQRKELAKEAGIRVTDLDAEVYKLRGPSTKAGDDSPELLSEAAQDPEPWPEDVVGAELLTQIRDFIERFIVAKQHVHTALALWVAFSYLLDTASNAIRIALLSGTKGCGKTRVMLVLELLCRRALSSANINATAIYRAVDALGDASCTLFLDEAHTLLSRTKEENDLVGILNAGFDRAHAFAIRNVPVGDGWAPKRFSTWAAIVYAFNLSKGEIPDTWLDRSIPIRMQRRRRGEKTEHLRQTNRKAFAEAIEIRRKLLRWSNDTRERLREASPQVPEALGDRAADGWHLLLAIAEAAGGTWPETARGAAMHFPVIARARRMIHWSLSCWLTCAICSMSDRPTS